MVSRYLFRAVQLPAVYSCFRPSPRRSSSQAFPQGPQKSPVPDATSPVKRAPGSRPCARVHGSAWMSQLRQRKWRHRVWRVSPSVPSLWHPVYWTGRFSAAGSGTKWKVKIFHQASREPLPGVGPGCPATRSDISLLPPSAWLSLWEVDRTKGGPIRFSYP